jgi:hypothetical protein
MEDNAVTDPLLRPLHRWILRPLVWYLQRTAAHIVRTSHEHKPDAAAKRFVAVVKLAAALSARPCDTIEVQL